jgi:hypothetical protein
MAEFVAGIGWIGPDRKPTGANDGQDNERVEDGVEAVETYTIAAFQTCFVESGD